jgi:EAL domain-containing protein (putative c-di-GMP-specific phosphodiesterase class I)
MIQYSSRTGGRSGPPSSADHLSLDHLDLLDERHIAIVEEAIAEGRVGYAIRNIHAIGDPDRLLYGECLPCLIERDGTEHISGGFVFALEALGQAPVLDRLMLRLVLDALESDPLAALGCHLSSDNFSNPETWAHIRNQIAARPELAPRLVLDIDATSPFADIGLAGDLLSEAKAFGCRVALGGFGYGDRIDLLWRDLDADIVKIDAPFVLIPSPHPDHPSALSVMAGLAARAARAVVAEGIETAEQLEIARLAGATHVQDQHVSKRVFPLLGG